MFSDSLSGFSYELFYSASFTNFSYQLLVEVSLVTMPPKRTIKSFGCIRVKLSTYWKWNCSKQRGSWGDGVIKMLGGVNKNGMSNFIFSPPTFCFTLLPQVISTPYIIICYQYGSCKVSWGPVGMSWFLMWEETEVPGENPQSQIEIDCNSAHIQWL